MQATAHHTTGISEIESIEKVLNAFAYGWNVHDVKKFSKVFTADADFSNVMGISRSGRNAIEEMHEPLFRTIWSSSVLTITKNKIRFIKPDVAAVDAWWDLVGSKDAAGNDLPPRNGLLSFIMTKENYDWMITVMHNMDLPGSTAQNC